MSIVRHLFYTFLFSILCVGLSNSAEASTAPTPIDWIETHGPEKPPPDDGYEFKGANGGNGLGKLGLACFGAGVVTSVLFVTAEDGTERKENMGRNTVGLLGGGLALLVIERMR